MQKYECTVCGYIYDPELGILMEELRLAQLLKIYRMTGYAPNVV